MNAKKQKLCASIMFFAVLLVFLSFLQFANAAGGTEYTLIEPLPGVGQTAPSFPAYVQKLIPLILSIAAVLAVLMIAYNGIVYAVSEAVGKKQDAIDGITQAILGLLLALASYLILYTINPQLIKLDFAPTSSITPGTDIAQQIAQQAAQQVDAKLQSAPGGSATCVTYYANGEVAGISPAIAGNSSQDANYQQCVNLCKTNPDFPRNGGVTRAVCYQSQNQLTVPQSQPSTQVQNIFCVIASPTKTYSENQQPGCLPNVTCSVPPNLQRADPGVTASCVTK